MQLSGVNCSFFITSIEGFHRICMSLLREELRELQIRIGESRENWRTRITICKPAAEKLFHPSIISFFTLLILVSFFNNNRPYLSFVIMLITVSTETIILLITFDIYTLKVSSNVVDCWQTFAGSRELFTGILIQMLRCDNTN